MIFKDKLNNIIKNLQVTNTAIANSSMLDISIISRFKNGKRTPIKGSPQLQKLCKGIVAIAISEQKSHVIFELCSKPYSENIDDLHSTLYNWLNEDLVDESNINNNHEEIENRKISSFGDKLNILKNIFKISNIQIAKHLNVDASLISRYCTGIRKPQYNNPFVGDICTYFSQRPRNSKQSSLLYDTMNITTSYGNTLSCDEMSNLIYKWICQADNSQDIEDAKLMNDFLYKLDTISSKISLSPLPYDKVVANISNVEQLEMFWGIEGIREAVIRFLSLVIKKWKKETLYLYSDQNIDWLTKDKSFSMVWASLMYYTLQNKNRIKMVHHLSRNLSEMLAAIESWLPFYITGLIEPFECKATIGNRFEHTMFIAPNLASITSFGVVGNTDNTNYLLDTNKENTQKYSDRFSAFLDSCEPLMHIFTIKSSNKYILQLDKFDKQKKNMSSLYSSLSIYTMSERLLYNILDRNKICDTDKEKILEYYRKRKTNFETIITTNTVKDICAINMDEELYLGKVCIDIPSFIIGKQLYYNLYEYNEHMSNIKNILENYENYSLCILSKNPFTNIQIIEKTNDKVYFGINDNPWAIFAVNNKLLNDAFIKYLEKLINDSTIVNKENPESLVKFDKIISETL